MYPDDIADIRGLIRTKMPSRIHHILLALCYVLAWFLPLVHEHDVARERAEHRFCMAEYCHCGAGDAENIHRECQHRHHDDEHCALCQSGQSARNGFLLVQRAVIPEPQDIPASAPEHHVYAVCQLRRHIIQPRAP